MKINLISCKLISLLFISVISTPATAMENSRPKSSEKDRLIELTAGEVWLPHDRVFELGVDFEYFPHQFEHHLSIGISTEVEFEKHNEFYAAPLISYYHSHHKLFISSGLQGHNGYWRLKNRIGYGHEFFIKKDLILVPGTFIDFIDNETHFSINLGLAKEF